MALFSMPWTIPAISSTATPPALERDSTAVYYNNVAGPFVETPPAPTAPKVGRPRRGDRAQVKAARRSRLRHR